MIQYIRRMRALLDDLEAASEGKSWLAARGISSRLIDLAQEVDWEAEKAAEKDRRRMFDDD